MLFFSHDKVFQIAFAPKVSPTSVAWSFVSRPVGSNATLTGSTTVTPSFVADVHGDYSIQLIVTDSLVTYGIAQYHRGGKALCGC